MRAEETIKFLCDEYRKIVDSKRNQEKKKLWQDVRAIRLDKFRSIPKKISEIGSPPILAWIELPMWSKLLGFDIARFYNEPLYYFENWLRTRIAYFNMFEDDNYFDDVVTIWLGAGFEATLFGLEQTYLPDTEPWIDRTDFLIKGEDDLGKLSYPDFYKSGMMPQQHGFYEEINRIGEPFGISATIQDFDEGPTSQCIFLRGFENLSIDFYTNPDFVHRVMAFFVESRKVWYRQWAKFMGKKEPEPGQIMADDVSVPNISPKIYDEFIFPYENEICEFHSGFTYYHNCGPLDPYLPAQKKFKKVMMMHSGPYSNYLEVGKYFGSDSAIEMHLMPEADVMGASVDRMKEKVKTVISDFRLLGVGAFCVRVSGYQSPGRNLQQNLTKIFEWTNAMKGIY
ncbi:MAG: hypothetical protein M1371_03230 [Actinobacteria bacterium]|nr:hypothetical protein [Actinomycetota bacterium]